MSNRKRRTNRRGATTVEFAMTAPIVFLLFFTSVEMGRVYMVRQTVQNAVYEAARRGLVPGTTDAQIRGAAARMLNAVSVRNTRIAVNQDSTQVTVTVSVNYNDVAWITPVFFRNTQLASTLTLNKDST